MKTIFMLMSMLSYQTDISYYLLIHLDESGQVKAGNDTILSFLDFNELRERLIEVLYKEHNLKDVNDAV